MFAGGRNRFAWGEIVFQFAVSKLRCPGRRIHDVYAMLGLVTSISSNLIVGKLVDMLGKYPVARINV